MQNTEAVGGIRLKQSKLEECHIGAVTEQGVCQV